jgi:hypothetical protein
VIIEASTADFVPAVRSADDAHAPVLFPWPGRPDPSSSFLGRPVSRERLSPASSASYSGESTHGS